MSSPGDDGAGEVEHGEVVLGALLPAGEQTPEAVEPGVGALDDPPSRAVARLVADRVGLFAAGAQMQRETELDRELAGLVVVIALVHA